MHSFEIEEPAVGRGDLRVATPGVPGESMTLWLPEVIWRDRPGRVKPPLPTNGDEALERYSVLSVFTSPEWSAVPWARTADGGVARTVTFADGRVSAAMTPGAGELLFELTVTNESPDTWCDCWAEVCLQLASSPSFADVRRERTFGRVDGSWTALSATPAATPDPASNIYRATPAVEFIERCTHYWCDEPPVQLDHPLIAVGNRADSAVIGVVSDRCAEYCNNLDEEMACIHSDPLLGNIEPGAAVTSRGKILYFEGSVADFLQHASAVAVAVPRP